MKHNAQTAWVLGLGFALALGCSARAQTLPFKSVNGYEFRIPGGWRMAYLNGPDIILLAPAPLLGTNITVVTNDEPPSMTLEAMREQANHSGQHPAKGFRQLSQDVARLGTERDIDTQVTYELGPPVGKIWARQVIFLRNGKEYELTCTTAISDKSAGNDLFDTLLKSLQWAAPLAPFSDDEFKQIDASDPAYAYLVPAGWTPHVIASSRDNQVILAGPDDHGFIPNISISSIDAPVGRTAENEAVIINAQFPQTLSHYAKQSQWFTSIDGAPALETCYTVSDGKKSVRGVQVFSLKAGRQYTLTGTFPAVGYQADQAVFGRLLASVRWANQ